MENPKITFLKNKKTLIFVLLFLVVSGIVLPNVKLAFAQFNPPYYNPHTGQVTGNAFGVEPKRGEADKGRIQCEGVLNVYCGLVSAIADSLDWIFWKAAAIASWLFSEVVSHFLDKPITKNSILFAGWSTVRDFANMLIVLGFVIVGIATTLRIQEYQAKKLLLPLIMIALLINFSNIFCGILIDTSNIAVKSLAGINPNGSQGMAIVETLVAADNAAAIEAGKDGDANAYLGSILWFCAFYLATAITFFVLSFIFIERYAILALLFILSPLAFTFWIFPASKKLWTEWWNHFLKWTFVGIQAMFFVWVATQMLGDPASATTSWTDLLVILVIMIVGVKIATKSSGMGASAIIGLAGGVAGLAMGAAGKAGMGALGATGLKGLAQRAGAGAKDKATAAGEKFGLVSKGTTVGNKAKRLEESRKRLDNITDNDQLAKIAEQRPITHQQMQDKAVAAEILAKRKALDKINPNKMDAIAAHAAAMGISKDTFTKERPQTFAGGATDTDAYNKIMADRAAEIVKNNPGTAADYALQVAKRGTPPSAVEIRQAGIDLRAQRTTENALGLAPMTDKDVQNKIIADKQKDLMDNAGYTYEAAQAYTKNMQVSPEEITIRRGSSAQERINKGFSRLSGEGVSKLPGEALKSREFIENVDAGRLSSAERFLSGQNSDDIKSHVAYLRSELRAAYAAGNRKRTDELRKKLGVVTQL